MRRVLRVPVSTLLRSGGACCSRAFFRPKDGSNPHEKPHTPHNGGKPLTPTTPGVETPSAAVQIPSIGILPPLDGNLCSAIERVEGAYLGYFDHIRFRNKWAEPQFSKMSVRPMFQEAAEYVIRIRQYLDVHNSEAKLRMVDGNAQQFLHSEEAGMLLKRPNEFVRQLVHASFKEAVGSYVEGLTSAVIDSFLSELVEHRFNPRQHLLHIVLTAEDVLKKFTMVNDLQQASSNAPVPAYLRDNTFYVTNQDEDNKWRDVIGKFSVALDGLRDLSDFKRKNDGK